MYKASLEGRLGTEYRKSTHPLLPTYNTFLSWIRITKCLKIFNNFKVYQCVSHDMWDQKQNLKIIEDFKAFNNFNPT